MCVLYLTDDKGIFLCSPFLSIRQLGFICDCENHVGFSHKKSLRREQIIIKQVLSRYISLLLLVSLLSDQPSEFCFKLLHSKYIPLVQPTRVRDISSESLYQQVNSKGNESILLDKSTMHKTDRSDLSEDEALISTFRAISRHRDPTTKCWKIQVMTKEG